MINEIHIYGYGKLENFTIRNLEDLNIFYGVNEAGKSTIMSFIHSVLFGFPTKLQTELRYEPKKSAKYGGQLVVTFPAGKAVIERVKGKAAGDVNVILEDGTTGGEELLKELLSKMDRSLFQSIFSFNLHGLQNVQQMKGEDLGKFLFSTGALGTDRLLSAESMLQKQLDSLYKPSGKKPYINEKLTGIKMFSHDLKKAELNNDQYWKYLEERKTIEKKIEDLYRENGNLQNKYAKLEEWKRLLPILKEEKALKQELAEIGSFEFPDNGLVRFEELMRELTPCENKMKSLLSRLKNLELEIENTAPNKELLANDIAINTAVENFPLYEQLKQEKNQIDLALKELQEEIEELQQKLHLSVEENQVLMSNTSVFMKEKTANAQRAELRLKEKKQELDEEFQQAKQDLEEIEERLRQFEGSILTDSDLEELYRQKNIAENQKQLELELLEAQGQISKIKNRISREALQEKAQQKQSLFQLLILAAIFIFLAGWSLFDQQWAILVLALAGLSYLVLFHKRKTSTRINELETELSELTEKEKTLENKLKSPAYQNADILVQKLADDSRQREQQSLMKLKWEQKNEQYEKILLLYEKWEQEIRIHHKLLADLGNEIGIPKEIALTYIHDAFILIEKLKGTIKEKKKLKEREQFISAELLQIESRIRELVIQFLPEENNVQLQNAVYLLKQDLKIHQELQIQHQEKEKIRLEWWKECQEYGNEKERIQLEINQLFEMANVETEADFRNLGIIDERKKSIAQRLTEINRHLTIIFISESDKMEFRTIKDPDQQMNILQTDKENCQKELIELQEKLAEVKYQIALLEDGGTYAELVHEFKLKQSELNEEAKKWAKFSIAKELLSKAAEQYKNQRLPKVIKKAEGFLAFLTEGQYVRIYSQKEGSGFLIESRDRTLFEPNELSQATSEQIYVSLRLALAVTLYDKYQFPIIIDDGFVNFDHQRTQKIIELLSGLKGHQVLFFTCHQHLLPFFNTGKVIEIQDLISNNLSLKNQVNGA